MAGGLLYDARQHASLLLERGPGQYGFIHLTFQEYLAAVAIAQLGQSDVGPVAKLLAAHVDDDTWRVVALLTIGYMGLIQQRDKAAGETLERLIRSEKGAPGAAAVLAGEAVLDTRPGGVTVCCQTMVAETLLATTLDDLNVAPPMRARAGSVLGALGDPRPGVGAVDGLPHVEWMPVQAGSLIMGDGTREHGIFTANFQISKYPVTNEQYATFVRATGYKTPSHWVAGAPPPDVRNHPVTYVSWDDAMAFCAWLGDQMGRAIRMPNEAEWEKTARGDRDRRRYPWGDNRPDENRCNFERSIGSTTPVGIYLAGESPYGCLDMSGNVWEWTSSLDMGYPYDPADGREDVSASGRRVVRGGAFYHARSSVRCAYRDRYNRGSRSYGLGFRLVAPGL